MKFVVFSIRFLCFLFLGITILVWGLGVIQAFVPTEKLWEPLALLLSWPPLAFTLSVDKSTLSYLIIVIFAHGILSMWRNFVAAQKELDATYSVINWSMRHSPNDFMRALKDAVDRLECAFTKHLKRLFSVAGENPKLVEQEPFVPDLYTDLGINQRPSHIYYMAVVGLIGTLAGIIKVFASFGRQFVKISADDNFIQAFRETMINALSGLDTAFYTTLLSSILGGILLHWIFSRIEDRKQEHAQRIQSWIAEKVIPLLKPAENAVMSGTDRAALEGLTDALKKHADAILPFEATLEQQIDTNDGIQEVVGILRNILDALNLNSEAERSHLAEIVSQLNEQYETRFQAIYQQQLTDKKDLSEIIQNYENLQGQMHDLLKLLSEQSKPQSPKSKRRKWLWGTNLDEIFNPTSTV